MKTSDFDYHLPQELIAQMPLPERAQSRMMVVRRDTRAFEHRHIGDLPAYLDSGDLLVVNDTRVIPARVFGHRTDTGGRVELLLIEREDKDGNWKLEIGNLDNHSSGSSEHRTPNTENGAVNPDLSLRSAAKTEPPTPITKHPSPITEPQVWRALYRASGRPRPGLAMTLCNEKLAARIMETQGNGQVLVEFSAERPLFDILDEEGFAPLPPYIKRTVGDSILEIRNSISTSPAAPKTGLPPLNFQPSTINHQPSTIPLPRTLNPGHLPPNTCHLTPNKFDRERYQTVYARHPGAIAAPTAGLHFTHALLDELAGHGVARTAVTLHVGPGTFLPVKSDMVGDHVMAPERYIVRHEAATAVNAARRSGGRIVAVGSTTVRTLETVARERNNMAHTLQGVSMSQIETVARERNNIVACSGAASLFIYPPYSFRIANAMLTNFHLPMSTLIMMVSAFAGQGHEGRDLILKAYAEAVRLKYRFYSYGDCMLIL